MTKSSFPAKTSTDRLFAVPKTQTEPFKFDAEVVDVFNDMINRSVPGYAQIINALPDILEPHIKPQSHIYDLGSSLGGASLMLAKAFVNFDISISALDYSQAMVEKSRQIMSAYKFASCVDVQQADITNAVLKPCDAAVMNFTLQFIAPEARHGVVDNIAKSIRSGGVLVLSEKISFEDDVFNQKVVDLHHEFKRHNGYSDLEISQKRSALEHVMITDTLSSHFQRLKDCGFTHCGVWMQQFNFVSIIAMKE